MLTPVMTGGGLRLADESRSVCDISPLNSPHTNTRLLEAHCNSPAHGSGLGSSVPGSPRHALLSPDSQPARVRRLVYAPRRCGGLLGVLGAAAATVALWLALATRQRAQHDAVARARIEATAAIRSTAEPFDRTVGARCSMHHSQQHEFWRDSLNPMVEPRAWDPAADDAACEAACAKRRWCVRVRGQSEGGLR